MPENTHPHIRTMLERYDFTVDDPYEALRENIETIEKGGKEGEVMIFHLGVEVRRSQEKYSNGVMVVGANSGGLDTRRERLNIEKSKEIFERFPAKQSD